MIHIMTHLNLGAAEKLTQVVALIMFFNIRN